MIHRYTSFGLGDLASPTTPLDLSFRMRELRARQGLRQSELARRMGLDPSIPSLWEQGKRPVPASRLRALADALGVPLDELLDGIPDAPRALPPPGTSRAFGVAAEPPLDDDEPRLSRTTPLLRLVAASDPEETPAPEEPEPPEVFQVAERPPLVGWIPEGWQPRDRVQDISPSLPDGYWLDPVRLERSSAKELVRSRLCPDDLRLIGNADVPGAAMAERIYQHCRERDGFIHIHIPGQTDVPTAGRLPLIESIFRAVLAAEHGGLSDAALVETLGDRAGAVPLTVPLLRRLRDSVRRYPMRSVDRRLFGRS